MPGNALRKAAALTRASGATDLRIRFCRISHTKDKCAPAIL